MESKVHLTYCILRDFKVSLVSFYDGGRKGIQVSMGRLFLRLLLVVTVMVDLVYTHEVLGGKKITEPRRMKTLHTLRVSV